MPGVFQRVQRVLRSTSYFFTSSKAFRSVRNPPDLSAPPDLRDLSVLKVHLHSELPLPRRADDRRDLPGVRHAARRVEHGRLRQAEIDVVGDVEAFRAQLDTASA